MIRRIDLNSDLGEGFGRWRAGDDAGLLGVVTSANIACGFHAGGPEEMERAMRQAVAGGIGIGAHPGFDDLRHFGRRRLPISPEAAGRMVAYQFGAARGMAALAGGAVRHLKLHGALSNMAAEDAALARACFEAALRIDPEVIVVILPGTRMMEVAGDLGCRYACEIFADRAYEDDATLVDRRLPGAVLHDPEAIARRVLAMLEAGAVLSRNGRAIPVPIDTVCVHGDTPGALDVARRLRDRLEEEGVTLAPFEGRRGAPRG